MEPTPPTPPATPPPTPKPTVLPPAKPVAKPAPLPVAAPPPPPAEPEPQAVEGSAHLLENLENAELLLSYVAQTGMLSDQSLVGVVVQTRRAIQDKSLDADLEVQFWTALSALVRMAQPMTVESLRANQSGKDLKGGISPVYKAARTTIGLYQFGSILSLVIMLIFQMYWLLGSRLIDDISQFTVKIEEQGRERAELQRFMPPEEAGNSWKMSTLQTNLNSNFERRDAAYEMLARLAVSTHIPAVESWYSTSQRHRTEIEMRFSLQAIQLYILPLFYGLLGAYAYVLRALSIGVRTMTYATKNKINYRMHLQLGTLAGLAIGWFIPPASSSILSLSPLALAFLAGYSVEVLFAMMDKLIHKFGGRDSKDSNNHAEAEKPEKVEG
jgi:hypothetical protein